MRVATATTPSTTSTGPTAKRTATCAQQHTNNVSDHSAVGDLQADACVELCTAAHCLAPKHSIACTATHPSATIHQCQCALQTVGALGTKTHTARHTVAGAGTAQLSCTKAVPYQHTAITHQQGAPLEPPPKHHVSGLETSEKPNAATLGSKAGFHTQPSTTCCTCMNSCMNSCMNCITAAARQPHLEHVAVPAPPVIQPVHQPRGREPEVTSNHTGGRGQGSRSAQVMQAAGSDS